MKKFKNEWLKLMMIFIAIISFISVSGTNPTVSINYNTTGLTPGSSITVPIVIDGGSYSIGGFELWINYDPDVLTYVSTSAPWGGLGGLFGSSGFIPNANYKLKITWSMTSSPVTLTTQQICTISFTFNGGYTGLTFYFEGTTQFPTASYIADNNFNFLTATWNNGSAKGSGVVINSANGGGNWAVASKWDLTVVPTASHDVFITNGNPITIATIVKSNDLTVKDGAQLTLNSTKTLTVNGNFSIKSTQANGTGSYVDFGTTTISGTCSMEQYMSGNWTSGVPTSANTFHEISSPVSGGTINTFLGDLLNQWDEPTSTWQALILPLTLPLEVGRGYATAPHTPGAVKTFTGGTLNTGNIIKSGLTRTGPTWTGYNLLGNPYPCALKFDSTLWSMTNLDPRLWVWDPALGNYRVANKLSPPTLTSNIIPAEDGFFVHVTSGTGSITIPNAQRQHSTQAFYKDVFADALYLTVNGNGYGDVMSVYFNTNAAAGYDAQYDALKLSGTKAAPMLYSILDDNTDLTVNTLPSISANGSVKLGFLVGVAGSYTITASGMESFASGTTIYLQDKQAGQTIDLVNNPVYTFDAAPSDPENRFMLLFNPVGISELNKYNVGIYSYDKDIYVNVPMNMQGNIIVYDLVGNQITTKSFSGKSLNKISLSNSGGYYVVKVIGDNGITTGKVYIR